MARYQRSRVAAVGVRRGGGGGHGRLLLRRNATLATGETLSEIPTSSSPAPRWSSSSPVSSSVVVPEHVCVVPDGSRRWSLANGGNAEMGYSHGAEALHRTVRGCRAAGVRALTVYAFSTDNWYRPAPEVAVLMRVMRESARRKTDELRDAGVCVRFVGNLSKLPAALRTQLAATEHATRNNTDMYLTVCLSYSGRQDILNACKELAASVASGELAAEDISEEDINSRLCTSYLTERGITSHPDVLIRTSGEQRTSNMMVWEAAYTELVFSRTPWPEFDEDDLHDAFREFGSRKRRFGR